MATADSVKAKIQGLIRKANSRTGRSDTDLTTAVDVLIDAMPSGTITIGANGSHNVARYAVATVSVPNSGIIPAGIKTIGANGTYDVTKFATAEVNVPTGTTPTGTISITENGTHDVTNYASAVVNVPVPAEKMVVRTITIASDLGNGTNTDKTILTADPFVAAHYSHDGFFAMLVPATQIASATNVVHSVYHGNFNIGSTNVVRYGFCYYSSSASAIAMRVMTAKLNATSYNVAMRARSTGNLSLYVESSRIVKAGTYNLILGCWS